MNAAEQPFDQVVRAHLDTYKQTRLGIPGSGTWGREQRSYPHILPSELYRLNILETIRKEFWGYFAGLRPAVQLHQYFPHLNSSQALAFNLFFPVLSEVEGRSGVLQALGLPSETLTTGRFEAVADPREGTNFDFCGDLESGGRLLVEVKYTEDGFGSCPRNPRYEERLLTIYADRLKGKTSTDAVGDEFYAGYQLYRNLSHVGPNDHLVLLVPRANTGTWKEGEQFVETRLSEPYRSRVHLVSLEEVCARLRTQTFASPLLEAHWVMLAEKYLPAGARPAPGLVDAAAEGLPADRASSARLARPITHDWGAARGGVRGADPGPPQCPPER